MILVWPVKVIAMNALTKTTVTRAKITLSI